MAFCNTADSQWVWDKVHGVETRTVIPVSKLGLSGKNAQSAVWYQATHWKLTSLLAELRIDYQYYSFVDFGCGKGKALLLASELPFASIIGAELPRKLIDVAAEKSCYRSSTQKCCNIELFCRKCSRIRSAR